MTKAAVLSGLGLGLALAAGVAHAETTLNALFMAQAAYSEADVRAMTDDFAKANPDVKVNLEFVPYEGLRDKTLLAQGSGRLRRRSVRRDLAGRIRHQQGAGRRLRPHHARDEQGHPARCLDHGRIRRQALRHALDPRHQVPVLQQGHAGQGRHRRAAQDLGRARPTGQDHQGQGHRRHRRSPGAGRRPRPRSATTPRCVSAYGGKFLDDDGKPASRPAAASRRWNTWCRR